MPSAEDESVQGDVTATAGDDVEMPDEQPSRVGIDDEATGETNDKPEDTAASTSFADSLASPIVTLVVGKDDEQTILSAHEALLCKSPYFAEACRGFVEDGSGEYFPRKLVGQRVLEDDPSMPKVDDTGVHLLRHARLYTLGEKFGVPDLQKLARSKIHCIDSTARGEIEYARYVYANTSNDDTKVRAPIASFWATRSHTLRAEAEEEFRALCLEYPQFGYEVLTRVLDDKLKRERNDKMHPATSSSRKRSRRSSQG